MAIASLVSGLAAAEARAATLKSIFSVLSRDLTPAGIFTLQHLGDAPAQFLDAQRCCSEHLWSYAAGVSAA